MNSAAPFPGTSMALAFGLDLAAKATALLAIVLLIQFFLGRRRAFLGAAAGNAGLIGLALLPFSAVLFPAVSIPCLPAGTIAPRGADPMTASVNGPPGDPFANAMSRVPAVDGLAFASETKDRPAPAPAPPAAATSPTPGAQTVAPTPPPPAASIGAGPIAWATIALAFYAVVASVLLARLGASLRAIARLRASCEPFAEVAWTEALDRWRGRLGIRRAVALASSPAVGVPLVLGWLRPVIVIPRRLTALEACGHADAVLLHELSHVRRGDYPWNLVLRVVQAFYWPHVLVWLLGRTIAGVRERACDDLCVHEMGGPGAYRETLLAVAAGMVRTPGPALGLAMARPSRLGRRLAQIDRSRGIDRCVPRWPARFALATLAAVAAVAIGAIQLVRAEARAGTQDDPPKAAATAPLASDSGRVFQLRVVAADTNEPVTDADVRVSMGLGTDWRKTDAQGRLDITYSTSPPGRSLVVHVWGKGRAMQRHIWGSDADTPIPDVETIKLQPGETLGGRVEDEEGRPIAGATISLRSNRYKKKDSHENLYYLRAVTGPDGMWQTSGAPETTGELFGYRVIHPDFLSLRDNSQKETIPKIADLRAGKAVTVMKKGVPIEGRVVSAEGAPVAGARILSMNDRNAMFGNVPWDLEEFAVSTDADGRFRTGQVMPGKWFLIASARGHGPADQGVTIGTAVPQVEITLGRPHPFRGRVVDPDGKPIAGAFIDPGTWRGYRGLGIHLWTDADGRFRWDDAPDDELIVNVRRKGYADISHKKVAPSGEDLVFTLAPSLSIQGSVLDAETKQKLDQAEVEYGAVDPRTGEPATWSGVARIGVSTGVRNGDLRVNFPATAGAYKLRIRSPGFTPFISRTFRREEQVVTNYDVELVPGRAGGAVATVLRRDGQPLAGARVYSTLERLNVKGSMVKDRGPGGKGREERTGPDGTFTLPQDEKPWLVLILGDDAYGYASRATLEKSPRIQTKPYARIEGRYLVGNRPAANRGLELNGQIQSRATMYVTLALNQTTTTDSDGRFTFKDVIPDDCLRVSLQDRRAGTHPDWLLGEPVRVEPGVTAEVTLGGRGRPVSGRVEPPRDWRKPVDFTDRSAASLESNRPWTPSPPSLFRGKSTLVETGWGEWADRWRESPEGRDYRDRRVAASVALAPDGSFRFDDVPPGEYRLSVQVNEGPPRRERGPFARTTLVFTVPPIPGGRSDEPVDLGTVELRTPVALKVGEPAPALEVTTVDGKALRVPGDFRGKFLLLDFGTMWDMQSSFQITRLNEVNQRFGKDPRFAILSLLFAADGVEARTFVQEKGQAWPQAIVGPLSNPMSFAYEVGDANVPAVVLIGPDGKVVAKDLWYEQIGKAVGEALSRARP